MEYFSKRFPTPESLRVFLLKTPPSKCGRDFYSWTLHFEQETLSLRNEVERWNFWKSLHIAVKKVLNEHEHPRTAFIHFDNVRDFFPRWLSHEEFGLMVFNVVLNILKHRDEKELKNE